jgi:hypothetical protein
VHRSPDSVLQDFSDQRRRAAAVDPAFARHGHDRLLQDVTIAVRRRLHGGLAIARIVVGNLLVPIRAERHRDRLRDGPAPALRHVGQVVVLRKLRQQRLVERRYFSLAERDPVEQTDDALGHRAQFVAALCRKADVLKACSTAIDADLILAFVISLRHHAAAPHDDDAVDV